MATNTGKGSRKGSIIKRTQTQTPSGNYVKRNTLTGKYMDVKTTDKKPFKGVAKEVDNRRD